MKASFVNFSQCCGKTPRTITILCDDNELVILYCSGCADELVAAGLLEEGEYEAERDEDKRTRERDAASRRRMDYERLRIEFEGKIE